MMPQTVGGCSSDCEALGDMLGEVALLLNFDGVRGRGSDVSLPGTEWTPKHEGP